MGVDVPVSRPLICFFVRGRVILDLFIFVRGRVMTAAQSFILI